MWTRRNVKRRGRNAMRANYWKTVLVSLILMFVLGGASGASGAGSSAAAAASGTGSAIQSQSQAQSGDVYEGVFSEDPLADESSGIDTLPSSPEAVITEVPDIVIKHMPGGIKNIQIPEEKKMTVLIVLCVLFLIILAIAIVIDAFLFNPLEVGIRQRSKKLHMGMITNI